MRTFLMLALIVNMCYDVYATKINTIEKEKTMIKIDIRKAKKCNGDYSLFVSFPFDYKIVDAIKELPTRFWNADTKEWEVPFSKLGTLTESLPAYEFNIEGPYIRMTKDDVEVPAEFEFKTKPFEHQIEGMKYGLQNTRWLLGDEQGLGKTKQVIDIAVAKKIMNGYKHCLIICGVNGLKWNWVNEVKTHSNESARILGQRKRANRIVIDGNSAKLDDLRHLDEIDDYFIITNVESLRDANITSELHKLCEKNVINMIAADEVHKMKNPSSQQGKAFLKLKADTMIAMTGTPLMNTPLDLYIIMKWLGFEKHSFYQFKAHYCTMGGFGGYQVIGYRNLEELQEQLNDIMLRRLKSDVLDLPDKLHVDEFVEMTPKQKQIYDEVTASIKMNIDQIKMENNPLAELIRMRQATGYTGILSSTIKESAKLDRMEELVDDAVQNGKQVVIFSNWTQMTDAIWARLHNKYRLSIITGETKDIDRQDNVAEFQSGGSQVIVGTIGAMGTGRTLTAGTVEIFMDEPWNRANKEQAEDRCHRVGTKENVTSYTIMCKNTIDERIHDLILQKGAMADAIVDGKITANKSDLLNYLLS